VAGVAGVVPAGARPIDRAVASAAMVAATIVRVSRFDMLVPPVPVPRAARLRVTLWESE
jgi:hypothetical protein